MAGKYLQGHGHAPETLDLGIVCLSRSPQRAHLPIRPLWLLQFHGTSPVLSSCTRLLFKATHLCLQWVWELEFSSRFNASALDFSC